MLAVLKRRRACDPVAAVPAEDDRAHLNLNSERSNRPASATATPRTRGLGIQTGRVILGLEVTAHLAQTPPAPAQPTWSGSCTGSRRAAATSPPGTAIRE